MLLVTHSLTSSFNMPLVTHCISFPLTIQYKVNRIFAQDLTALSHQTDWPIICKSVGSATGGEATRLTEHPKNYALKQKGHHVTGWIKGCHLDNLWSSQYDNHQFSPWWRHQMETFSMSLALCVGNSPVNDEFPTQRPVTWSYDVFFDLRLNKGLSKQWWGWWFKTLSCSLWRHCNEWWKSHQHDNLSVSVCTYFMLCCVLL